MAVGANVPVTVVSTLSDAGTVTFSSGDQVTLDSSASSVSGSLTANGTNFINGGGGSNIAVSSGGDLDRQCLDLRSPARPDVRLDRQPPVRGL